MSMQDILQKVMGRIPNEDIVPKISKTATEEETTFIRLEKEREDNEDEESQTRPTKKAKLDCSKLDEKVKEVTDGPEKENATKDGHPEEKKHFFKGRRC